VSMAEAMPTLPEAVRTKLDELADHVDELNRRLVDPEVLADHNQVRELSIKKAALDPVVDGYRRYRDIVAESAELQAAIDSGDDAAITEELGDLLLQVVLDAQIGADEGRFCLLEVVQGITKKMIDRHPHVFGDAKVTSPAEQTESWEAIKAAERAEAGRSPDPLADVPLALPALARAAKLQRRAARAGHTAALPEAPAAELDAEQLGQRLFALVALANRDGLDPEQAVREVSARFSDRVRKGAP